MIPEYTDASRAATGMLEVFTTRIVRFISASPVFGSLRCGNSSSTSAISFPRSPHPTYTITSALQYFESVCSTTVLPVPNPPGTMAEPPKGIGNMQSSTRCPVMKGWSPGNLRAAGRGDLTGHECNEVANLIVQQAARTKGQRPGH